MIGRALRRARTIRRLSAALADPAYPDGRSLQALMKISPYGEQDTRDLLIDVGARGFTLADGREGWTLRPVR